MEQSQVLRTLSTGNLSTVSLISDGKKERTLKTIILYNDNRDRDILVEV